VGEKGDVGSDALMRCGGSWAADSCEVRGDKKIAALVRLFLGLVLGALGKEGLWDFNAVIVSARWFVCYMSSFG